MASIDSDRDGQLDSILESSESIVIVLDGKSRVMRLSRGARRILGYEDGSLQGNSVNMIIPPDRRDWMSAISKRVREDGVVSEVFMHWRTKDGRRLICKSILKSVINYQGEIVGMIISEDAGTVQGMGEERISSQQALDLLEDSEIAMTVTDLSGNVMSFSSGAEKLTGFSEHQVVGASISRLFLNREVLADITTRALRDGKVEDSEAILVDRAGDRIQVSISLSVLRNPSRAATGFSFVLFDISKRKEMERELEIRAQKLRLVNELAARIRSGRSLDDIYSVALDGLHRLVGFDMMSLVLVNDREGQIEITSVSGKHPSWLSVGRELPRELGPFSRALRDGEPVFYTPSDLRHLLSEEPQDGFQSAVMIPLMAGERLLGLLNLTSAEGGAFGERDIDILAPVANHIGLAVETSRLVTALMENINIQTVLIETGTAVRSVVGLEEVYATAVSRARELVPCDVVALYLLEENHLVLTHFSGAAELPQELSPNDEGYVVDFFFSSGGSSARDLATMDDAASWEIRSFRSMLLSRLIGRSGAMGVLLLGRREGTTPFTSYEFELLNLYCNHLCPSIENAQMFEELRRNEMTLRRALDSERRTREALDFFVDMFAHDARNQVQAILGYLDLIDQIGGETVENYVEKASRQLRAVSYMVSGIAQIFREIDSGRIIRSDGEIYRALVDALDRFSSVNPSVIVKGMDVTTVDDGTQGGDIDPLLSELFFHITRLMTRGHASSEMHVAFSKPVDESGPSISFRVDTSALTEELLRRIDRDGDSRLASTSLIDPFVVRLLGEIYGVSISAGHGDAEDGEGGRELICTLWFRRG